MKINKISPSPGATRTNNRRGRGPGSGNGKTGGRGSKGQKSRSGYHRKRGFEGGQMPLMRRVPKRGFTNPFRKEFAPVNVERLNVFPKGATVTPDDLIQARIVRRLDDGVAILGGGEIKHALTVRAHRFSETARAKIEKAGGTAEVIA